MYSPKSRSAARRTLGGLLVVGAALIWALDAPAQAAAGDPGDPRATAFPGNATTCADAGLAGHILIGSPDSSGASNPLITVVSDGTYLDVTVQPGVSVTGAVVKGGPNYNVYPGGLFVDGTENDLHAPLVANDNVPMISHWFICGTIGGTTTPPTTTATSTTATSTTATSTTATSTTATPSATTTTSGLPNTGTPVGDLGLLGFGLLAVGAVLLIAPGQLSRSRKH